MVKKSDSEDQPLVDEGHGQSDPEVESDGIPVGVHVSAKDKPAGWESVVIDLDNEEDMEKRVDAQIAEEDADTAQTEPFPQSQEIKPLPPMEGISLESDSTPIMEAHNEISLVLRERSSTFAKALYSNVLRDKPKGKDGAVGVGLGFGAFMITGEPVSSLAIVAIGFIARNIKRLVVIKSSRDKVGESNIKELSSFWNLTCYKFVRLVKGYNARVEVINALRSDGVELDLAKDWEVRLIEARPKLLRAGDDLNFLQQLTYSQQREELEERVRRKDPLGYAMAGVPQLDWLDLDSDKIRHSMAVEQFTSDVVAMKDLAERHKVMQDSHQEVDESLTGESSVYTDLEEKFGEEAEAVLERIRREEEEED